jgi:hypothetical protein
VIINKVVYDGPENGKKFIALAEKGVIYSSTDGVDWTAVTVENASTYTFNGAAYGNDTFIAVANNSTTPRIGVATSTDGISWTLQTINTTDSGVNLINSKGGGTYGGNQIAFHEGKFIVCLGTTAVIAKTTNGTNIELAANFEFTLNSTKIDTSGYDSSYIPVKNTAFSEVIFTNDQCIVTGTQNYLAFSAKNAETWTAITPTDVSTSKSSSLRVASYGGRVVIAGIRTSVPKAIIIQSTSVPLSATSAWGKFEIPTTVSSLSAIVYGDNKVIVAGNSGWMVVAHEETLK